MWKTVKLGDVCKINNGGTPSSGEKSYWGGNIQWLTPKDMGRLESKFVYETERQITVSGLENSSAKIVPKKSVILSCRAPIGHVFINTEEMAFNQGCKGLVPQNGLMTEYLYYFLYSSKQLLNDLGTGTTFKEISGKILSSVLIPLPPLAEQQRIVEKLDKAFEEIDRAIEATSNAQLSLASFQESRVKEYFVDNITGAQVVPLAQVAEYFNGLTYSPKDVSESGTIVLRSSNIQNGEMSYADIVRVNKEIKEKLIVRDSDILVCSRNGSKALIGKSALIGHAEEKMTFGTFMMIIRSSYNNYLQWFFKSSLFRSQIVQGENTMINQITRYMLDKVTLPFPPENIQSEIALELSDIDAQVRALTEIYCRKKNSLNALKSAILAQELKGPES